MRCSVLTRLRPDPIGRSFFMSVDRVWKQKMANGEAVMWDVGNKQKGRKEVAIYR